MPTKSLKQPGYCHHKSSDQAHVRLDGRSFNLGKYGSDERRREYDRPISFWLANGRRMPDSGDQGAVPSSR